MKLWVLCYMIAAATARPAGKPETVEVTLNDIKNPGGDKGFSIRYELSDGTRVQSRGELVKVVNDGKESQALIITGRYSFQSDGVEYIVTYTADENGYQPEIIEKKAWSPGYPGMPGTPGQPGVPSYVYASLLGSG